MVEVGIRALQHSATALVARAAAGETVLITEHGRPVAQLASVAGGRVTQLVATGQARPPKLSLMDLPIPSTGPSLSTELAVMREEDRH